MEPIARSNGPDGDSDIFQDREANVRQVPTPERLMAHRLPLMLGIGGLYGAIEWFGTIDSQFAPCSTCKWPLFTACRTEWTSATPSA